MDDYLQIGYEFGGFRVDPMRRILFGPDSRPIALKPKVFDTLLFLVEHPQELIDKRTLMKAIWPDVVVVENNLTQAISMLRRVFGEHPGEHRFIVTEPGRGYRFIATVRQIEAPCQESAKVAVQNPVPPQSFRRLRGARMTAIAGLFLVAITIIVLRELDYGAVPMARPSVAVLPFENLSADLQHAEFVHGVHDDTLTQLAKISALKVIARTSVMPYDGVARDPREIGRQLGVATILEGTVKRSADRVRINVQLVDTNSSELLWTESYDRKMTVENLFLIQNDIARRIARALEATVTTSDVGRLERQPTRSSNAWEYYVSGRNYYRGSDLQRDLPASVMQFERAVAEDSGFALAWAHLGIAHTHMYWTIDRKDERRDLALAAAQRALALDPDLPEGHLALAWYHYQGHLDFENALKELALAEAGMPGDIDLLFAQGAIYRRLGRWSEAVASWERAIELDPRNANLLRQHASTLRRLRQYDQAETYLNRVLEIAPDAVEAQIEKAEIPLLRDGEAGPLLAATIGNPMIPEHKQVGVSYAMAIRARDYDRALGILADWQDDVLVDFRFGYLPTASARATVLRLAGDTARARDQFSVALAHLAAMRPNERSEPRILIALGEALVGVGDTSAGIKLGLEALALMPTSREALDGPLYQLDAIKRVLVPGGAVDEAFRELDAYLAAPGFWSIEALAKDPRLDLLRADPRFAVLEEKYRRF